MHCEGDCSGFDHDLSSRHLLAARRASPPPHLHAAHSIRVRHELTRLFLSVAVMSTDSPYL